MSKDIGRPTKYKPEMCEIAYKILCKGGSVVKICATLDIDKTTYYDWLRVNSDFSHAIKRGLPHAEVVWEENPPLMSDARYIFNMKNKFGWADKQLERAQRYSELFTKDGIAKMMSEGEMTVDTGIKLLELLAKQDELDSDEEITVNLVLPEGLVEDEAE